MLKNDQLFLTSARRTFTAASIVKKQNEKSNCWVRIMDCNQSGSGFDKCFVAFYSNPPAPTVKRYLIRSVRYFSPYWRFFTVRSVGIAWINWQEAQSLLDEITLDNLDDETKNRSRKNFE